MLILRKLVAAALFAVAASPAQAAVCAYAGTFDYDNYVGSVVVIDGASNTVAAEIGGKQGCPQFSNCFTNDIVVAPGVLVAYIASGAFVLVADLQTHAVIDAIAIGGDGVGVEQIALSTDGSKLYGLLNQRELAVVDLASRSTVAAIEILDNRDLALSPDGAFVYVVRAPGGVTIVDALTNEVAGRIPGANGNVIAVTPDGRSAYFAPSLDVVFAGDLENAEVIAMISIPECRNGGTTTRCSVSDLAIDPQGRRVYTVNSRDGSISVIDAAQNAVVDMFRLDEVLGQTLRPNRIAVTPDGGLLYVTGGRPAMSDGTPGVARVWVVDSTTGAVVHTTDLSTSAGSFGTAVGPITVADVPHACAGGPITPSATPTSTPTPTPTGAGRDGGGCVVGEEGRGPFPLLSLLLLAANACRRRRFEATMNGERAVMSRFRSHRRSAGGETNVG